MNALQKRELELFQAFLQVCRQLKLPYFLVCGSALGAVKYQGFIPWDDDMDIAMLRPRLRSISGAGSSPPPRAHFLQNYKTDPAFRHLQQAPPLRHPLPGSVCPGPSHSPGDFHRPLPPGRLPGGAGPAAASGAAEAPLPPPSGLRLLRAGPFSGPCSASWAVTGGRRSLPPP